MAPYEEAVNWLYNQLPMFQRIGAAAYKADLKNTIKLCNHFNNPQNSFPSIHIAGTNGKGSTSHMLASILQESGYKVGLYTSPHLKSFTERIRINGKEVGEAFVIDFVNNNKDFFTSFDPSFFEITVAMAFSYFEKEKVDIAVIETGLGGRLDSTNIITPILSVITNIGWDHQQLLGDTLPKIAAEKAGIIKKEIPVIVGEYQVEVAEVFENKAREQNASLMFASKELKTFSKKNIQQNEIPYQQFQFQQSQIVTEVTTDLLGVYQEQNCKTVLKAVQEIQKMGYHQISDYSLKSGFAKVGLNTGLKGRWQLLNASPKIIADTGHNIDGIKLIIQQLQTESYQTLRMVVGFVNDKSISEILQILPKQAIYYFTQASIPRAKQAKDVYEEAIKFDLRGSYFESTHLALQQAKLDSGKDDLIYIGGSTFVVAELI